MTIIVKFDELLKLDASLFELELNCHTVGSGCVEITRAWYSDIPIFFSVVNDSVILATNIHEVKQKRILVGESQEIDPEFMALYLKYQAPDSKICLYKNVSLLRPGEKLILNVTSGQWKTELQDLTAPNPTKTPSEFREHFRNIVKRMPGNRRAYHISSGLDSTAIAIAANDLIETGPINLFTCETLGKGASDEIENIQKIADDLSANLQIIDLTDVDPFLSCGPLYTDIIGFPVAHPSHILEYYIDIEVCNQGFDTIVNGKGPDDVLAGYPWYSEDCSFYSSFEQRKRVTQPELISELLSKAHRNLDFTSSPLIKTESISKHDRFLMDNRSLTEGWNSIHSSIARKLNVNVVSPFMDRELRREMWANMDLQTSLGSKNKEFLRAAFCHDYPKYLTEFPKTGFRLDLKPYLEKFYDSKLLQRVLVEPEVAANWFNIDVVKSMLESTLTGDKNFGWQLWSVHALMSVICKHHSISEHR